MMQDAININHVIWRVTILTHSYIKSLEGVKKL